MADVDMTDAPPVAKKKGGDAEGKKRFEVKKVRKPHDQRRVFIPHEKRADVWWLQWNAVALWAWDIVVDNCAICRNHIMDLCMLYRSASCPWRPLHSY